MNTYGINLDTANLGLFVARVVAGLLMAAHGSQKLFGWFRGYGLSGTSGFFEQLGFQPGRAFAALAGSAEFISGLLVALGFLGPVGPALMVSVMVVAMITVHRGNGLLATSNGVEVPLLYSAVVVGFALTGFGAFSLDAFVGLAGRWPVAVTWTVLAVGVLGGLANIALRRRPAPASATTAP